MMWDDDHVRCAIDAARRGGEVLEDWAGRFSVREKSPANLVTDADVAAQEAIVGVLRRSFPSYGFLAEEDLNEAGVDSDYRWVIDPLDGTSNYVHRFPYYAVSIGLEFRGELQAGVIFDPTRSELFVAAKGRGAWLDGEPIRPSEVDHIQKSLVVASLPVATTVNNVATQRLLKVLPHAQTVQRTGSAALNLAYVACGRIDAFWSTSLKAWDAAAGAILVTESGGTISRLDGTPFDIHIPDLLSSNGSAVHAQLGELLESCSPA